MNKTEAPSTRIETPISRTEAPSSRIETEGPKLRNEEEAPKQRIRPATSIKSLSPSF